MTSLRLSLQKGSISQQTSEPLTVRRRYVRVKAVRYLHQRALRYQSAIYLGIFICSIFSKRHMNFVGFLAPPYSPPIVFSFIALSIRVQAVRAKHSSFQYLLMNTRLRASLSIIWIELFYVIIGSGYQRTLLNYLYWLGLKEFKKILNIKGGNKTTSIIIDQQHLIDSNNQLFPYTIQIKFAHNIEIELRKHNMITDLTNKQDTLALRKFGLQVPHSQHEQVLKQIRATPALKQEFEKIKQSLATMLDEDMFLETVASSHQKISQIPENSKVIQIREGTYVIRAINPQQIQSLTQRAFFNSFSLQRIMLKDSECQQIIKASKQAQQKKDPKQFFSKNNNQNEDPEKCFCICGKNKDKEVEWIQCANEGKCRGTSWYHLECSGLGDIPREELESLNYICMYCKRGGEESNLSSDGNKRVKKN